MIKRALEVKIRSLFKELPLVVVTGPRQSGKTTLIKKIFPKLKYVSLEDPDSRVFSLNDPPLFL